MSSVGRRWAPRAGSKRGRTWQREAAVLEIYVDADGCPVKDEVYRVADRYGLRVWVVANAWLRVPDSPLVSLVEEATGATDTVVSRGRVIVDGGTFTGRTGAGAFLKRSTR